MSHNPVSDAQPDTVQMSEDHSSLSHAHASSNVSPLSSPLPKMSKQSSSAYQSHYEMNEASCQTTYSDHASNPIHDSYGKEWTPSSTRPRSPPGLSPKRGNYNYNSNPESPIQAPPTLYLPSGAYPWAERPMADYSLATQAGYITSESKEHPHQGMGRSRSWYVETGGIVSASARSGRMVAE